MQDVVGICATHMQHVCKLHTEMCAHASIFFFNKGDHCQDVDHCQYHLGIDHCQDGNRCQDRDPSQNENKHADD